MSEYAECFSENDVDLSELPHYPITISRSLASRSGIDERCWPRSRSAPARLKRPRGLHRHGRSHSATTPERRCLCVIVLASRILVIPLSVRHVRIA
jgi:hypothetical protein